MKFALLRAARIAVLLATLGFIRLAQAEMTMTPSPEWAQAMPSGPVAGTRMTTEYVKQIGRMAYFWAWPMMNIQNRLVTFRPVKAFGLSGGVLPVGPVNEVTMLTDYIEPSERAVACPNQDVVYGQAVLDMAKEPVVIQVPDFTAASSSTRSSISAPTRSPMSARCMRPNQASIFLPDLTGVAPRQKASQECFVRRPTSVL
jgi:hypothetical protein